MYVRVRPERNAPPQTLKNRDGWTQVDIMQRAAAAAAIAIGLIKKGDFLTGEDLRSQSPFITTRTINFACRTRRGSLAGKKKRTVLMKSYCAQK